jgi:CRP/FNR family transcriptional regulator, cyclic AMP receptor protein
MRRDTNNGALQVVTVSGLEAQTFFSRYWDQPSTDDWVKVLGRFSLFSGFSKRRLRKLVRHATTAEYVRGDTVVAMNDAVDSLYLILSGSARASGKPAARMLRAGDYFGELGLLEGAPASATIIATSELHVMKLPRQSFLRLAHHDPTFSVTMLKNLGAQFRRLEAQTAAQI